MAKPYDSTLKFLLDTFPEDWLRLVGLPEGVTADPLSLDDPRLSAVDSNLSTITAEADKVFEVHDREPWLLHIEVQSGYDPSLPDRMLLYNVLLRHRRRRPVRSVGLLLAPKADGPAMIGRVAQRLPDADRDYLTFDYGIIRAWSLPRDLLLSGGLGTLPLAVLTAETGDELPGLIGSIDRRIACEASLETLPELRGAVPLLAGLRFPADVLISAIKDPEKMKQSSFYQHALEEGRLEEARRILLTLGTDAFGAPDEGTRTRIDATSEQKRIEEWIRRVRTATHWDDLLGG